MTIAGIASTSNPTHASSLNDHHTVPVAPTPHERKSLPAELGRYTSLSDYLRKQRAPQDTVMAPYYNTPSRQRTQYYDEQFQYKDNVNEGTIRERVQRDSPVVAELRTNVIIKDEFTLVTDLSCHLAARYTRPDSAVMVKVDHSACLAMGGTFDPCYILSITAVPSQMGPTMNKRNAALIQSFMADILSVSPDRGVVKFQPIPEENFATNGTTMAGVIERQEKHHSGDHSGGVRRAMNNVGRKSLPNFKKSMSKMNNDAKVDMVAAAAAESPPGGDSMMRPPTVRTDSAAPSSISEDVQDTTMQASAAATTTLSEATPAVEVYELPATEMEKERPVTVHKRKSSGGGTNTGGNGLRMNPVSSTSTTPTTPKTAKKARPKTFSGESPSRRVHSHTKSDSNSNSIAAAAAAATGAAKPWAHLSAPPPSKKERPHSFLKHDPTNTVAKATPTNTSRPTTPRQRLSTSRAKENLIAGTAFPQVPSKQLNGDWTNESAQERSRRKIERLTGEDPDAKKKETEANTAKRRASIAATPKLPPMPVDQPDSSSIVLGKRKSFLSAFKRNTAKAQHAH